MTYEFPNVPEFPEVPPDEPEGVYKYTSSDNILTVLLTVSENTET